jgi:transposase
MHKFVSIPALRWVGIDVSARELAVAMQDGDAPPTLTRFPNTTVGHRQLIRHLVGRSSALRARVVLEASGNYSLDLCLTLDRDPRLQLWVVNPRQARNFALSLGQRSKTDPVDAVMLCQYARRMADLPWHRPSATALRLRAMTRTLQSLTHMATEEKNRQHAMAVSQALPAIVRHTLHHHLQSIERCQKKLERAAQQLVARDPQLQRRLQLLDSVPGISVHSALLILAELATIPSSLDARQWVAQAGLDPCHYTSGSSVQRKPHISKAGNRRLRAALYMPALVAVRFDPHLAGFYQRLLARGKVKLVALTAVMRKLLHAIYAMFLHDQLYDGAKLCPLPPCAP